MFIFILLSYSFTLDFLSNAEVLPVSSLIVTALLFICLIYLRIVFKVTVFTNFFFIPRGLITIVLFY
jgi:hypothetical protein